MLSRLKRAAGYLLYRSFRGLQKLAARFGAAGWLNWLQRHPSWLIVLGIAVTSDALDYLGGAIPVVGDLIDVATTVVLTPFIGPKTGAVTLVELVPGADFMPTYTVMTLFAMWRRYRRGGGGVELTTMNAKSWRNTSNAAGTV